MKKILNGEVIEMTEEEYEEWKQELEEHPIPEELSDSDAVNILMGVES